MQTRTLLRPVTTASTVGHRSTGRGPGNHSQAERENEEPGNRASAPSLTCVGNRSAHNTIRIKTLESSSVSLPTRLFKKLVPTLCVVNADQDAPASSGSVARRLCRPSIETRERPRMHSHTERGNEKREAGFCRDFTPGIIWIEMYFICCMRQKRDTAFSRRLSIQPAGEPIPCKVCKEIHGPYSGSVSPP